MLQIPMKFTFWFTVCAYSLSACSDGELDADHQLTETTREFSEADKKAARTLSISNTEIMAKTDSPYEQALLCLHGLAQIESVISDTSGLSIQQQEGLQQAKALFNQRLRDLASTNGKSAEDIRKDLAQTAEDNLDKATNVRVAIGCLERL